MARNRDKEATLLDWQQDEVREAFNLFDADATGEISYRDARAAMRALDYSPSKLELRSLLEDADPKQTGYLNFDAFKGIMTKHAATVDPKAEADKIFAMFTSSTGSKAITYHNLRDVARELGESMSDQELTKMLQALTQGDGSRGRGDLSRDDFSKIMVPKTDLHDVDD